MFRIAICSRQLCCQHLDTFGPSLSYTVSLKIIDPAGPHLTLDMLTIILVVPCTYFGLLLWNQQKNEAFRSLNVLPLQKGSDLLILSVRTLKNFVNIFVLKSETETLEIPTLVMFCFS